MIKDDTAKPDFTIINSINRTKEKQKQEYYKNFQDAPKFANYFSSINEDSENVENNC